MKQIYKKLPSTIIGYILCTALIWNAFIFTRLRFNPGAIGLGIRRATRAENERQQLEELQANVAMPDLSAIALTSPQLARQQLQAAQSAVYLAADPVEIPSAPVQTIALPPVAPPTAPPQPPETYAPPPAPAMPPLPIGQLPAVVGTMPTTPNWHQIDQMSDSDLFNALQMGHVIPATQLPPDTLLNILARLYPLINNYGAAPALINAYLITSNTLVEFLIGKRAEYLATTAAAPGT